MSIIEDSGKEYAKHLVKDIVLPRIHNYLQTKFPENEITIDNLIEALDVSPEFRLSTPSSFTNLAGGKSIHYSSSGAPRSSSSKKKEPELIYEKPEEGVKCIYIWTRGRKEGTYCGKPCVEGLKYCKYCRNKAKKNKVPKNKPNSKTSSSKKEEDTCLVIDVKKYHYLDNYFLHCETNFILYEDDQSVCAVAKELENGDIRSLTDNEKIEAKKHTLVTIRDTDKEQEALDTLRSLVGKDKTTETEEFPKKELESEELEDETLETEKVPEQELEDAENLQDEVETVSSNTIPVDEEPLITKEYKVPVLSNIQEVPFL